jgi:peptidoglycan/LPS O-acetylase OafA/YrhL
MNKATAIGSRFTYLDGLRGIAATLVLFEHIFEVLIHDTRWAAIDGGFLAAVFGDTINIGRFGVILFFLISGFVIPFSLNEKSTIKGFLISRFFRLYPLYWISILFCLLCMILTNSSIPKFSNIIANLTMIQAFLGESNLIGVYWTLTVELVFYGMCVILFYLGLLRSPWLLCSIIITILAGGCALYLWDGTLADRLPVAALVNISFMFFGTLLRLALIERTPSAQFLVWIAGVAVIISTPIILFLIHDNMVAQSGLLTFRNDLIGTTAALATFALGLWHKPEFGREMIWLGAVSYGLYLFQSPIVDVFRFLIDGSTASFAFYVVATVTTSFAVSGSIHSLLENPINKWGRRIAAQG